MQIVGLMEDEVQSVLELVAAVLKLGNIEFKPESRVNGFDESRVKDKNGECLVLSKSNNFFNGFLSRLILITLLNCTSQFSNMFRISVITVHIKNKKKSNLLSIMLICSC